MGVALYNLNNDMLLKGFTHDKKEFFFI